MNDVSLGLILAGGVAFAIAINANKRIVQVGAWIVVVGIAFMAFPDLQNLPQAVRNGSDAAVNTIVTTK